MRIEPELGSLDSTFSSIDRPRTSTPFDPHRRKEWVALFWGLLSSPIAFAYVGMLKTVAIVYLGLSITMYALGKLGLVQSVHGFWAFLAVVILFSLWVIFWPMIVAIRARAPYKLKWYNRWYCYPLVAIGFTTPFYYEMTHREQLFGFGIYHVPSGSMEPTIARDDYIVTDSREKHVEPIFRGQVLVVRNKTKPAILEVRRVVGLPGEHVTVTNDFISIDGNALKESYTQGGNDLGPRWMTFTDVKLGRDEYFLMGDNRGNSIDSRSDGPYSRSLFISKVSAIWLANDFSRVGEVN